MHPLQISTEMKTTTLLQCVQVMVKRDLTNDLELLNGMLTVPSVQWIYLQKECPSLYTPKEALGRIYIWTLQQICSENQSVNQFRAPAKGVMRLSKTAEGFGDSRRLYFPIYIWLYIPNFPNYIWLFIPIFPNFQICALDLQDEDKWSQMNARMKSCPQPLHSNPHHPTPAFILSIVVHPGKGSLAMMCCPWLSTTSPTLKSQHC